MAEQQDRATQLSQAVEREVRMMIGDLTMQTIVLRQMLEMSGQQQPQQPQPSPAPQPPPPQPAQPGQQPDRPPEQAPDRRATNGFSPARGA
jgi:hypothetical protein